MKSLFRCISVITCVFVLCSSCDSDDKDLEKLVYASAIGIDYVDNTYHCYVQLIDLQSIAKTEGEKREAKVWVGKGTGNNLEDALFELYQTAQERIFWGHLTSIIISESAFKQGFEKFYDLISRYYEYRRTPWVFGTSESIHDILSTGGFFGQSPLSSILHEPEGTYSQSSTVKPLQFHRFISYFFEPGCTTIVPTLSLNKVQWKERMEVEPKLMISGAIFLKDKVFQSNIPLKELSGLRWVQQGSKRAGISVPSDTDASVQVVFEDPKVKYKLDQSGERLQYQIYIKAKGYIVSRFDNSLLEPQELSKHTKEAIEAEIQKLIKVGAERNTDVLNVEYNLYRYHYNKWKSYTSKQEQPLFHENIIRDIHIDLNIEHSSSEKNSLLY